MSRVSGLVGRVLGSPSRSARHKLHAVRFGRLLASLRALVELGDDASDKLGGEWILDRSYVAAFVQRTLDRAREVVFDSVVLAGDDSAGLLARLDAVRGALARLMAGAVPEPAAEDGAVGGDHLEEPEYRLLRAVRERLALASKAPESTGGPSTTATPTLAEVLEEAHERALRSFEGLRFRSWGRRAGHALVESGFSGSVRVVDAGGGLARGADWGSRLGWSEIGSGPFRALLDPLFSSGRTVSHAGPGPAALAILAGERCTLTVGWPEGELVIDARLQEHAPANFIYCALRGEPPGDAPPLTGALTESGFRLLELGPGLTGWRTGDREADTRTALGRMGRPLEGLLRT